MDIKANEDVLHEGHNIATEEPSASNAQHPITRGYSDSARIITLRESETDSEFGDGNVEDSGIAEDDIVDNVGSESDEDVHDTPQSPSSERVTLPSSDVREEEDREESARLDVIWGRRGDPPHQVKLKKKSFVVQQQKGKNRVFFKKHSK